MGSVKSFSARSESASSASVALPGKNKKHQPKPDLIGFKANVLLAPSWMGADHEDCYMLGKLMRLFRPDNGEVIPHLTRNELCERIYGRAAVSQDEDDKLNRSMWELHRMGFLTLTTQEVEK